MSKVKKIKLRDHNYNNTIQIWDAENYNPDEPSISAIGFQVKNHPSNKKGEMMLIGKDQIPKMIKFLSKFL